MLNRSIVIGQQTNGLWTIIRTKNEAKQTTYKSSKIADLSCCRVYNFSNMDEKSYTSLCGELYMDLKKKRRFKTRSDITKIFLKYANKIRVEIPDNDGFYFISELNYLKEDLTNMDLVRVESEQTISSPIEDSYMSVEDAFMRDYALMMQENEIIVPCNRKRLVIDD